MTKFKLFDAGELVGELEADIRSAERAAEKMVANGFTVEWVVRACQACGGTGRVMIDRQEWMCGNCGGTGRKR